MLTGEGGIGEDVSGGEVGGGAGVRSLEEGMGDDVRRGDGDCRSCSSRKGLGGGRMIGADDASICSGPLPTWSVRPG